MILRIAMKVAFFVLGIVIGVLLVYNVPHHHTTDAVEISCEPVLQPYLSLD